MRYSRVCWYLLSAVCCTCAVADEVRYYEQNGLTYKETTAVVRRPVREIEYQDQQQTFYRERYETNMHASQYVGYQPVTQYRWEPRWHDWWNIFEGPHVAYHLRPQVTWQPRWQTYQVPVTQRTVVPETRTVRVAVPKLTMKEEKQVTRTAVGPAAGTTKLSQAPAAAPSLAWNLPATPTYVYGYPQQPVYVPVYPGTQYAYVTPGWGYGGVARLEGDPPRYGLGGVDEGAWQARRDVTETR